MSKYVISLLLFLTVGHQTVSAFSLPAWFTNNQRALGATLLIGGLFGFLLGRAKLLSIYNSELPSETGKSARKILELTYQFDVQVDELVRVFVMGNKNYSSLTEEDWEKQIQVFFGYIHDRYYENKIPSMQNNPQNIKIFTDCSPAESDDEKVKKMLNRAALMARRLNFHLIPRDQLPSDVLSDRSGKAAIFWCIVEIAKNTLPNNIAPRSPSLSAELRLLKNKTRLMDKKITRMKNVIIGGAVTAVAGALMLILKQNK